MGNRQKEQNQSQIFDLICTSLTQKGKDQMFKKDQMNQFLEMIPVSYKKILDMNLADLRKEGKLINKKKSDLSRSSRELILRRLEVVEMAKQADKIAKEEAAKEEAAATEEPTKESKLVIQETTNE